MKRLGLLLAVLGVPIRASAGTPLNSPLKLHVGLLAETEAAPDPGDMGFDLLGAPPPPAAAPDEGRMKTRRTLLNIHQGLGIGLLAVSTTMMVFGQLNYSDRFGGGPSTGKFETPHTVLAFTTLGLFVATGLMALVAPSPLQERSEGIDRVTLHKIGMFTAAVGMAAQAALGIWTVNREGYINQTSVARAHLVVGYVTYAAMLFGVGALVF